MSKEEQAMSRDFLFFIKHWVGLAIGNDIFVGIA